MKVGDVIVISWVVDYDSLIDSVKVGDIGIVKRISPSNAIFNAIFDTKQTLINFDINNNNNYGYKYMTLNEYRQKKLERILK